MYKSYPSIRVFAVVILLALISITSSGAQLSDNEQRLLSTINVDSMMATIERLCADDFAGRKAGSPEHYQVVDYLKDRFHSAGLHPLEYYGLEEYKQPLYMRYALIRSKDDIKATLSYTVDGKQRMHTFSYRRFSGNGGLDLKSEVIFVGHGVYDPQSGYDDYAGHDVDGKIVLWLPGKPDGEKIIGSVTEAHKLLTAYQRGAVGCLIYAPEGVRDVQGTNVGLSGAIADFPYLAIDTQIASEILATSRVHPDMLANYGHYGRVVGTEVRLQVTPVNDPERRTYNVLGMIPGSDPQVAQEKVLIGAHYDHLGTTPCGQVFAGADDNASGVAVMLQVAEAIRDAGLSPRRTIVFASWTGEEVGLIGSNYFTENPPVNLENVVSSVNLDMVGVGTPGHFMTTGASAFPDHYHHLESSGDDLGYELTADVIRGASDHLAFARKGIPSSLIHSAGERLHYHTIRDVPSIINPEVVESSARLAILAVWRAANS